MTTTTEEHLTTADLAKVARTGGNSEAPANTSTENPPLFPENVAADLRSQWERIQTGFVDEPRATVQQADELVAQVISRLAESFAAERTRLENQWDHSGDGNTEEFRVALRTYRSFFQRLLAI